MQSGAILINIRRAHLITTMTAVRTSHAFTAFQKERIVNCKYPRYFWNVSVLEIVSMLTGLISRSGLVNQLACGMVENREFISCYVVIVS